jgi:hypothetical protein
MGFVCTARESEPELIDDAVVVPIGYHDAEPKSYSLLIAFDDLPGGVGEEFFFCVVEANTETNAEVRYWSGQDVAKFASASDRIFIRTKLFAGTEPLL